MHKGFYLGATVKALDPTDPRGSFEAIVSVPTVDRDGEVVAAGAFNPLPSSVPVHYAHNFRQVVGRGVPSYEGDVLVLRGKFASTRFAQEIRTLVVDEAIQHMSVGFMPPEREDRDGVPHITKAELLEVSFTSVPSNRESAILAAKSAEIVDLAEAYRELTEAHEAFGKALRESQGMTYASTSNATTTTTGKAGIGFFTVSGEEKATATDPEQKAAAQAAADSPAEVPVDEAQAVLALLDAFTQGALTS